MKGLLSVEAPKTFKKTVTHLLEPTQLHPPLRNPFKNTLKNHKVKNLLLIAIYQDNTPFFLYLENSTQYLKTLY